MKKLTLFFAVLMIAIVSAACVAFTACNGESNGTKLEYTVTVLGEDELTGVSDVTVRWSDNGVKATATTDASGKAKASIAASTYEVTLSNLPEGLTCSSATVTSSARGITMVLERAKVDYTVSVKNSDDTPASGVTVNWRKANNSSAAVKTTGADGKATANLAYGEYSVSVSNLPAGSYYVGVKTVTGAQPDTAFKLESDGAVVNYEITVKSEGGLLFKKYTVSAYKDDELATTAETDDEGCATLTLPEGNEYIVRVHNVPAGYTYNPVILSAAASAEIKLVSAPIQTAPADTTRYLIGDIIHDFDFTTPYQINGAALRYSISEILKTKKAIVLNFWGTNCSACMQEMPAMQQAYELYSDKAEFLAVSNYMGGDSNSTIEAFRNDNDYEFPMFRDTHNFTSKFALKAWPTNVIIDRYGAIARIEDGALTSVSFWKKLLDQYVADDYVQTFIPGIDRNDSTVIEMAKPDVTVGNNHYEEVAAAINDKTAMPDGCSVVWFGEPEATAEFTWPFMLKTLDGETVLYPSNTDHDNTFSLIYADITMPAGKVFTFDYWAQTEADKDVFYVFVDNKITYTISGEADGWKTCYVYADVIDGTHQIAFSYIKDVSLGAGFDNVYIKNARFVELSAITQSTNMLRGAAYGVPETGAETFLHYATVEKQGRYYFVDASKLVGAQYAGNDAHPMLFANFNDPTNWNKLSISNIISATDEKNGEYEYDCVFEYNGKTQDWRELLSDYASLAKNSDISGYVPVDDDLRALLTAFARHISGSTNQNEWLEICYFFSHYGSGEPFGNPIIGLTESTAIEMEEGETYNADLTRNMAPYAITRYTFTPDKDGVYKLESFIDESQAQAYWAQVWVYTDDIDDYFHYSGDNRINRNEINEQNFVSYLYLKGGQKYYIAVSFLMSQTGNYDFSITYHGDSAAQLTPCASGNHVIVGNHLEPEYAVEYKKDENGYYHALNGDGSLGDFIYLDFKYTTLGNIYNPLSIIIDQYVTDPLNSSKKLYKVFDFTQVISYYPNIEIDGDGNAVITSYSYDVIDLTSYGENYKDYTDVMKAYCEEAMENDGMLKVTDELVEILTMYFYLRTDMVENDVLPEPSSNEWLKFCWYNKTIDEKTPA